MSVHAIAHARWFAHVNGVNPSREMRGWLVDTASLTMKLVACSDRFRVQRLSQQSEVCLADEFAEVALPCRRRVQAREVLLLCDGRPTVYAHTIVPLNATTSDWPFFGTLGERSLGSTLFGDPRVTRGSLQFARLRARHPLARRACAAIGADQTELPIFARRCLYQRRHGVLLVTELFLPAIADLRPANRDKMRSGAIPESTK
jgi:chorismate lyase